MLCREEMERVLREWEPEQEEVAEEWEARLWQVLEEDANVRHADMK